MSREGENGRRSGTFQVRRAPRLQVTDTSANEAAAASVGAFTVTINVGVPTAVGTATDVSGGTRHTIVVAYTDALAIDVSTIDDDDVVVNPGALAAELVRVDVSPNGAQTFYSITAPGGTWDAADNGTYTIEVRAGEVTNTSGVAVAAGTIGTFTVNVVESPRGSSGGCSMNARTAGASSSSPLALALLALVASWARRARLRERA